MGIGFESYRMGAWFNSDIHTLLVYLPDERRGFINKVGDWQMAMMIAGKRVK